MIGWSNWRHRRWRVLWLGGLFPLSPVCAQVGEETIDEIELLMDTAVIEANKEADRLFDVPITAHVFAADDILRLPVDSLPELLRYAPGVHILRANNGKWGLGLRGMASAFFSRVSMRVDEQNICTLYAGLFGSQHDLLMDDIASVEVVQGPGGGLWSTNAMNGMVNVILKTAFETQGTIVRLQGGSMNRGFSIRSGRSWNHEKSAGRIYLKMGSRESGETAGLFEDDWNTGRLGFRMDHRPSPDALFSLSGDLYASDLSGARQSFDAVLRQPFLDLTPERQWGINAQAKWTRQLSPDSGYSVLWNLGYMEYDAAFASSDLGVLGLQSSGTWHPVDAHELIVNSSVTVESEALHETDSTRFSSRGETNMVSQIGFQDDWSIVEDQLSLVGGVTLRHEWYVDEFSVLPFLRLLFRIGERDRAWFSYSEGARTLPVGVGTVENVLYSAKKIPAVSFPTAEGDVPVSRSISWGYIAEEESSETLSAIEVGYRHQSRGGHSFGVNGFYYRYGRVFGGTGTGFRPVFDVEEPYFESFLEVDDMAEGNSYGGELYGEWKWSERLSVKLTYAFIEDRFESRVFSSDPLLQAITDDSVASIDNNVPRHQATLWWQGDLSDEFELDLGLRYAAGYPTTIGHQEAVFQADLRLGWKPTDWMKWSLVGRNLLAEETREFYLRDMIGESTAQPREWYVELRLEF